MSSKPKIAASCLCQECGIIDHINSTDNIFIKKLFSLGICTGCPIKIEKISVFKDPIIFNINGSSIALRKKDAQKIIVTKI
ncbi:MAG: FeoA family protein [Brevinema sp.]